MAAIQRTDLGGVYVRDATVDLASIAANTTVEVDVTVTDVLATDVLLGVNSPAALNAGLAVVDGRVKSANTVTIRVANVTGGALDAASGSFKFVIGRL